MNKDPLFVNAISNDYRILNESPCRDAGIPEYIFQNETIANLSKYTYNGIAPDMGMFESLLTSASIKEINNIMYPIISNYPNPFNSRVTISFTIPTTIHVKVTVYNILGTKIITLVDNIFISGLHTLTWNACMESTGIYFYKIETGSLMKTGKMLLLK
jgi:hypothetical protein